MGIGLTRNLVSAARLEDAKISPKVQFWMASLRPNSVVRFGIFEVLFQSGEIRRAGLKIRVQQQPLKVLQILLERPGEVVTREHLRTRLGAQETFGDFDQALNIAIGKLRSALGDSSESPRYIETLPKRGYRFIADVTVIDADTGADRPESVAGISRTQEPPPNNPSSPQPDNPPPAPVGNRCVEAAAVDNQWNRCGFGAVSVCLDGGRVSDSLRVRPVPTYSISSSAAT
jgi:DNA-binding winged helix-turn-helix (wHTH) protein